MFHPFESPFIDDSPKVARIVLKDDYQTFGDQLKTEQKTSWNGAVVSSAVDIFEEKGTGAKITWKLPAPLGLKGLNNDKFEIDKKGGLRICTGRCFEG